MIELLKIVKNELYLIISIIISSHNPSNNFHQMLSVGSINLSTQACVKGR